MEIQRSTEGPNGVKPEVAQWNALQANLFVDIAAVLFSNEHEDKFDSWWKPEPEWNASHGAKPLLTLQQRSWAAPSSDVLCNPCPSSRRHLLHLILPNHPVTLTRNRLSLQPSGPKHKPNVQSCSHAGDTARADTCATAQTAAYSHHPVIPAHTSHNGHSSLQPHWQEGRVLDKQLYVHLATKRAGF